jgi:hypothetical protein
VDSSNSVWVPPSGVSDLQIIHVVHLGGQREAKWVFEYFPPDEPVKKGVTLSGTDMYVTLASQKRILNDSRKQHSCCRLGEELEDSLSSQRTYRVSGGGHICPTATICMTFQKQE